MPHKHSRYEIQGAQVAWEPWTFWHTFKKGLVKPDAVRHVLMNVGTHGLEFNTLHPPEKKTSVLVNVFLPGEADPFCMRGDVVWAKKREGHRSVRVGVKFRKCPSRLVERIRKISDSVI